MGRTHLDPSFGLSANPAAKGAAAWKDQRVRAVPVDDGHFEIALEWRVRYRLPLLHNNFMNNLG